MAAADSLGGDCGASLDAPTDFLEPHDSHKWEKSSLPARAVLVSQNHLEHYQSLAQQRRQIFLPLARKGENVA